MTNLKSVDFIVTAKHYGDGSARGYIRKMQRDIHRRGIAVRIKGLDAEPTGTPVTARIWQGQWIAECECGGASFVDPDEPIFFCFGCGNRINDSHPRPVSFPPEMERLEIERLILERPVNDVAGLTDLERAGMAQPVIHVQKQGRSVPLTRSWSPGESIEDLHEQQDEAIKKWRKELKDGIR